MIYDNLHGYIYVGNEDNGTYRFSFKTDKILVSKDLSFKSKWICNSNKSYVYLSNQGNYFLVDEGSGSREVVRDFRYYRIDGYFDGNEKVNGILQIPRHNSCYVNHVVIDEIRKEWFVFFHDGGCAGFDWKVDSEVSVVLPKSIRYTYCVDALWLGLNKDIPITDQRVRSFSSSRGVIINFKSQYTLIGKDADGFATINSLSASVDGSRICSSYGYGGRTGSYGMREVFINDIHIDKNEINTDIKIQRKAIRIPYRFDLIRLSSISPNGDFIAFAASGDDDRWSDTSRIGICSVDYPTGDAFCWRVPEMIFKINFDTYGKYVYFLGGDDMVKCKASLYVLNMQGKMVSSFISEKIVVEPDMVIWDEGAKVAVWDTGILSGDLHIRIYDILNNKESRIDLPMSDNEEVKDKISLSCVLLKSAGCLVLSAGRTLFFVDLWKETLTDRKTLSTKMELKGVLEHDRKLLMIDKESYLWTYDLINHEMVRIKDDVAAVYPTKDGHHLYTVNAIFDTHGDKFRKDTEVSYCGIDGTVYKSALLRAGAGKCCLTENGFLVSDYNNDILMFDPEANIDIINDRKDRTNVLETITSYCIGEADMENPRILFDKAKERCENGDFAEAVHLYRKAVAIYNRLAQKDPKQWMSYIAIANYNLGFSLNKSNDLSEAVRAYSSSLMIYRQLNTSAPDIYDDDIADLLHKLGNLYHRQQNEAEAVKKYAEALDVYIKMNVTSGGKFDVTIANLHYISGISYRLLSDPDKAETEFMRALDSFRKLSVSNPERHNEHIADTIYKLAKLHHYDFKDYQTAKKEYDEAMTIYKMENTEKSEAFDSVIADVLNNMGYLHYNIKDTDRAVELWNEALIIYQKLNANAPGSYESTIQGLIKNISMLSR